MQVHGDQASVDTMNMTSLAAALDLCLAPKKLSTDVCDDIVYQAKRVIAMTVDRTISTAPDTRMPPPFDKWTHQSALNALWGQYAAIATHKKHMLARENIEDEHFVDITASIMVLHSLYGCPALCLARQAFESKILSAIEQYWMRVEERMAGIMTYEVFVARVRDSIANNVQCGPPVGGWVETILTM